MNFFFIASLLVAVASASEADQAPEATANLRGVANNADEDNLEAFEAVMMSADEGRGGRGGHGGRWRPGHWGGRGGRGGRGGGWCQHMKGCSEYDYCRDSGCGRCKNDSCTKPRDEDEEEFNQDVVHTTTE